MQMNEPSVPKTQTSIEQNLNQIDNFIKCASIAAYKKGIQNVGVVSCRFSQNIKQNSIKQYIFANPGKATRLLIPILLSNRIVLAVFYWDDTRVEYYDSLKKDICAEFHAVKDKVEKFLSIKFNMTNQAVIYENINNNPLPFLANVHICRIAEELCFLERYKKFEKFDIKSEARRIKRILEFVAAPSWDGHWVQDSGDKRIEVAAGSSNKNLNINGSNIFPSTSTSNSILKPSDTTTEKSIIPGVPGILQNMLIRNRQIDSTINNVVNNVNRIFENEASITRTQQERLNMNAAIETAAAKNLNMAEIMSIYDTKYPILSKMLKFYSNLTKLRHDKYKDAEISVTFQKNFNWKLYSDLNTFEKEKGGELLKEFPYFSELSFIDKSFLLQRFWTSFWFFERICDTLINFGDTLPKNFIMLQDKSIYDLEALIKENTFGNRKEWKEVEKIIFGYWNTVLSMMKELKPDIIEIMYIFCCIFWNLTFLNVNLSPRDDEIIRRGRLVINNEMREFYEYNDERWNRIYLLKEILVITENSVKEYKQKFVIH